MLVFCIFFLNISLASEQIIESPPLKVTSTIINDSVPVKPQHSSIAETINELPGVRVQAYSGEGSLTTVVTPQGFNAASTSLNATKNPA